MREKLYTGVHTPTGTLVEVIDNGRRGLNPRLDLCNHSPTGFSWGYGGSGPSQLALALLADALGDDELALSYYQDFKWKFVVCWSDGWRITSAEIVSWVADQMIGASTRKAVAR